MQNTTESSDNHNQDEQFTEELTAPPVEKKAERIDTRELKDEANLDRKSVV